MQKLVVYKPQIMLGLYLAQRIVSKLSKKERKKKNHSYHPSELLSSPLTLFPNSLRNIASWLAASNIISSPVHFWIEQSVLRYVLCYHQPSLGLGYHYFSLHYGSYKIKHKAQLLVFYFLSRLGGERGEGRAAGVITWVTELCKTPRNQNMTQIPDFDYKEFT